MRSGGRYSTALAPAAGVRSSTDGAVHARRRSVAAAAHTMCGGGPSSRSEGIWGATTAAESRTWGDAGSEVAATDGTDGYAAARGITRQSVHFSKTGINRETRSSTRQEKLDKNKRPSRSTSTPCETTSRWKGAEGWLYLGQGYAETRDVHARAGKHKHKKRFEAREINDPHDQA